MFIYEHPIALNAQSFSIISNECMFFTEIFIKEIKRNGNKKKRRKRNEWMLKRSNNQNDRY